MIPSHKTIAPLTFYILFLSENEEKRNETVIKSSEEKKIYMYMGMLCF